MSKKHIFLISSTIGLVLFFLSMDLGMFWDNVLFASKMGNHLYENGLLNWYIPDEFDPAHPPFLGFVLAVFWKIFGHSLWVSHLAMIPFVIGFLVQLLNFLHHFLEKSRIVFLGSLFVLADPTLSTAMVLVNPEIIILFFFFLSVNGILQKKQSRVFIGFFFLGIISYRSMMLLTGLVLFDLLNTFWLEKKSLNKIEVFKKLIFYFLSSIPGLTYLIWRYFAKGWVYTHPNSPWFDYSHTVTFSGFLKNVVVLIHRYLDFGRVFIFVFLLIALLKFGAKISKDKEIKKLLTLAVSSVSIIIIAVLISNNAFGHRYFIVSYILFSFIAFLVIVRFSNYKKILFIALLAGLISGNLWIYPEKISQGWDASLAHLPYHGLRKEAIRYLDEEKIDLSTVGTFFPNYNPIDEIELNGDQRKVHKFDRTQSYLIYSNVYNLTDDEYDFIEKNYIEIKSFERQNIHVSILKKVN